MKHIYNLHKYKYSLIILKRRTLMKLKKTWNFTKILKNVKLMIIHANYQIT